MASAAQAATVPDAQYINNLRVDGPVSVVGSKLTPNPTAGETISNGSIWSASTQNNYTIPYISATASTTNGAFGALAQSTLTYFMTISGPTSTVLIHLEAEADTSASGDSAFPTATLKILGTIDGGNELSYTACSRCSGSSSFSVDETHTFVTGSTYQIQMSATVIGAINGTGTAWVDPFFSAPDGYTITVSANIGNAPLADAVPEPATWAMMMLGFAGVGFMARRRRKVAARAA